MSSPVGETFPSPVGGSPFSTDFVPSIIFIACYATLNPLIIYRMVSKRSRTVLLIGPAAFATGRIVDFVLRALQAHTASDRTSSHLVTYLQTTYALGYITMGQSLIAFLRCLIMNTPKKGSLEGAHGDGNVELGSLMDHMDDTPGATTQSEISSIVSEKDREEPESSSHRIMRHAFLVQALSFYGVLALAMVAGALYFNAITKPFTARLVQLLRYLGTSIPLVLFIATMVGTTVGCIRSPHVPLNRALFICVASFLLSVVAIYRLVVMRFQTTALESMAPGSLNSTNSKATFYIFHIVPELFVVTALFSVNVREMFGTGPFGRG